MKILKVVNRRCDAYQRFRREPERFRVSLPSGDTPVLGDGISTNIMFLESDAVLHILNTAVRISAASFLGKRNVTFRQSVKGIWLAFVMIWSLV